MQTIVGQVFLSLVLALCFSGCVPVPLCVSGLVTWFDNVPFFVSCSTSVCHLLVSVPVPLCASLCPWFVTANFVCQPLTSRYASHSCLRACVPLSVSLWSGALVGSSYQLTSSVFSYLAPSAVASGATRTHPRCLSLSLTRSGCALFLSRRLCPFHSSSVWLR